MMMNGRWAMIVAFPLLAFAGCQDARATAGDTTKIPVPTDKFRVAIPAHWHLALSVHTDQSKVDSYVPEGQSREHWTDMLSVIVYDRSIYTELNDLADALGTIYNRICAVPAIVAPPTMTKDNGSAASLQIARCGKGRDGHAHIAVQRVIAGSDGFYVVKRAWTLPPVADSNNVAVPNAEMKEATAEVNAFHLCDTAQHSTACPNEGAARPTTR
jgi:hypothetical protein